MSGPGGAESDLDQARELAAATFNAAGAIPPTSYLDRLAEAERNVLSMALLWLNDQTVASDTLADVIQAYADVLDSQERGL